MRFFNLRLIDKHPILSPIEGVAAGDPTTLLAPGMIEKTGKSPLTGTRPILTPAR
jgi:hypothetical protein